MFLSIKEIKRCEYIIVKYIIVNSHDWNPFSLSSQAYFAVLYFFGENYIYCEKIIYHWKINITEVK